MNPRIRKYKNLNTAELRSAIKRVNQRIVQIAKTFGKDSNTYKDAIAPLQSDKYSKYTGESRSGYFKLDVDVRKIQNDNTFLNLLAMADGSVKGTRVLKDKARERLRERGEATDNASVIEEVEKTKYYDQEMSKLMEYIYETHTDAEAREEYPELFRGEDGSRPSYEQLDEILARDQEERDQWFDSLRKQELSYADNL